MRERFSLSILAMLVTAGATAAGTDPALTIYRSDSDTLFEPGSAPIADGHAVVHERRMLQVGSGSAVIDGLPAMLDTEAVSIDLGGAGRVLAQRVVAAGDAGALAAHRGERVQVFGDDGKPIADGVLVALDGDNIGIRGANGRISYVREFARIDFAEGAGLPGSTLQLAIEGKPGAVAAELTYPTSGLGWRASYAAHLIGPDDGCRLRLDALASIANRSGREYSGAQLKLVAGAPSFARYGGPRMMAAKAMSAEAAPAAPPAQSALGDYRSYAIGGSLDLPDASVTQVPLYASRELDCERRWLVEAGGGGWFPPKPMLAPEGFQSGSGPVQSQLGFIAVENLPGGNLRVMTRDSDGRSELLGEIRIGDTPKGRTVDVELGQAFDLVAARERTVFSVDRGAREMNEGFRITLTNTGETARTITVREHPNRWRAWTLLTSSRKPDRQTPDLLEFRVAVPANGKSSLDYTVHYAWTADAD